MKTKTLWIALFASRLGRMVPTGRFVRAAGGRQDACQLRGVVGVLGGVRERRAEACLGHPRVYP